MIYDDPPPSVADLAVEFEADFWSHVDTNGDCWIWRGQTNESGYGVFLGASGILPWTDWPYTELAHRIAYWLSGRRCPQGWHLHHDCRIKQCVKPLHLFPMSPDAHYELHRRDHHEPVLGEALRLSAPVAWPYHKGAA